MKFASGSSAILAIARDCIAMEQQERPELLWLQRHHMHIQKKYNLKNKQDTDRFLYERMYGQQPKKTSELMKMRYWRTGRYTPGNREQCLLYGKALELSEDEIRYLLQNYYDRSLEVFDPETCQESKSYQEKTLYMRRLIDTYLHRLSKETLSFYKVSETELESSLRHLYFTELFYYVHLYIVPESELLKRHIVSTRYDSEFKRQVKLLGEIPRKTMIRHLIIFNLPDLTLEKLNEQLTFFGYLPLCEDHTMTGGEHLDWLLIHLLHMYEKVCRDKDEVERLAWFREICHILDRFFAESGKPRMRFMYFKSLDLEKEVYRENS